MKKSFLLSCFITTCFISLGFANTVTLINHDNVSLTIHLSNTAHIIGTASIVLAPNHMQTYTVLKSGNECNAYPSDPSTYMDVKFNTPTGSGSGLLGVGLRCDRTSTPHTDPNKVNVSGFIATNLAFSWGRYDNLPNMVIKFCSPANYPCN